MPTTTENRDELINLAVDFLKNPKVMQQGEERKKAFLISKGLSEEEIAIAFSTANTSLYAVAPLDVAMPSQIVPANYYAQPTFLTRFRDICNVIVFIFGMMYGFNYIWKHYLRPWLTGQKHKSLEEELLEMQRSLLTTLQKIEQKLIDINSSIDIQSQASKNQLQGKLKLTHKVEEMTEKINSVQGLLVNRQAFSALPPSIPVWQRKDSGSPVGVAEKTALSESSCDALPVYDAKNDDGQNHGYSSDSEGSAEEDIEYAG